MKRRRNALSCSQDGLGSEEKLGRDGTCSRGFVDGHVSPPLPCLHTPLSLSCRRRLPRRHGEVSSIRDQKEGKRR